MQEDIHRVSEVVLTEQRHQLYTDFGLALKEKSPQTEQEITTLIKKYLEEYISFDNSYLGVVETIGSLFDLANDYSLNVRKNFELASDFKPDKVEEFISSQEIFELPEGVTSQVNQAEHLKEFKISMKALLSQDASDSNEVNQIAKRTILAKVKACFPENGTYSDLKELVIQFFTQLILLQDEFNLSTFDFTQFNLSEVDKFIGENKLATVSTSFT